MQLYKKQKLFFQFFSTFLKSRIKFEHFEEKDDPNGLCLLEFTDFEERGKTNAKKVPFRKTLPQATW